MGKLRLIEKEKTINSKNCLKWILLVSMSPIAIFIGIFMILLKLLQFLYKTFLLFIIVAINTPFAMVYNISIVVFEYNLFCFKGDGDYWPQSDPRADVSIEVQLIVSDFLKVVAGDLLLFMSTAIITYFTASRPLFYISTSVWLVAIFHKWLNTECLSKTALSCLCGGYGLNPLVFLFSFIGLFDIGCHPIAKCSFVAKRAYLFVEGGHNPMNKRILHLGESRDIEHGDNQTYDDSQTYDHREFNSKDEIFLKGNKDEKMERKEDEKEKKEKKLEKKEEEKKSFECSKWDAFERGFFQLKPRIVFIKKKNGKYILKSSMVLKCLHEVYLCEYPVERLELPEDYSKVNELYNFLVTSLEDGFVTDKIRGRYELSLTLSEIVDGVQKSVSYKILKSLEDEVFVVAGCSKK